MYIYLKKQRVLTPTQSGVKTIHAEVVQFDGQFDAKLYIGKKLVANAIFNSEADAVLQADHFISKVVAKLDMGGVTIIVIDDSDF